MVIIENRTLNRNERISLALVVCMLFGGILSGLSVGGLNGATGVDYVLLPGFSVHHDPVFEGRLPFFVGFFEDSLYRWSYHTMYLGGIDLGQFAIHHRPKNYWIKAAKLGKFQEAVVGRVAHHARPKEVVPR